MQWPLALLAIFPLTAQTKIFDAIRYRGEIIRNSASIRSGGFTAKSRYSARTDHFRGTPGTRELALPNAPKSAVLPGRYVLPFLN